MQSFLAELRTQRWDDHRYYHHSRINQSLHFLSAVSFLVAYVMLFKDPVAAALIGLIFMLPPHLSAVVEDLRVIWLLIDALVVNDCPGVRNLRDRRRMQDLSH